MKTRILSLLVLISFAVVSCQKDDSEKGLVKQDVSFGITEVNPNLTKDDGDPFACPVDEAGNLLVPTVAQLELKDADNNVLGPFYPELFVLNGKLYTQAIKLDPGVYTVTKFLLLTAIGGDIVMATPETGGVYSEYVTKSVGFTITVGAFVKTEIDVEVLCFLEEKFEEFGFFWFRITEIVVRELCFFGDLCVKNPAEYAGSWYANQATGLQIDMPAIMQLVVKVDGVAVPGSPFTNASDAANWGLGAPVCVRYPDVLNEVEEITIELYIYVAVGNGFGYVPFHTWTLDDEEKIIDGGDGVVDFVLGNCNYSTTDLQLAPYMNLPNTASINLQHNANGTPWYWDLTINSVSPAGTYDIPSTGFMAGWCGDATEVIGNGSHTFSVYSSLVPASWPTGMPAYITSAKLNSVNWLFNNLGTYGISISGMYIDPLDNLSVSEGHTMQNAIWRIINGGSGPAFFNEPNLLSPTMATAALANPAFTPLPGGWAAIILVPHVGGIPDATKAQLIMTVVDP